MAQEYQNMNNVVSGMVRIGKVTDVSNDKLQARVLYQDSGMTSDWLQVVKNFPFIPGYDVPQRTEFESGGSGEAAFERHKHDLIIKPWMPKINEIVLVIYLPVRDGDGFILGSLQPG